MRRIILSIGAAAVLAVACTSLPTTVRISADMKTRLQQLKEVRGQSRAAEALRRGCRDKAQLALDAQDDMLAGRATTKDAEHKLADANTVCAKWDVAFAAEGSADMAPPAPPVVVPDLAKPADLAPAAIVDGAVRG